MGPFGGNDVGPGHRAGAGGGRGGGSSGRGSPENGNGGPVLNYDQLTEMALKFSPDVKASRSEVKLAKEQKNEVHGYRFPQFDATVLGGVVPNAHLPVQTTAGQPLLQRDPKDTTHGVNIFGHMDFTFIQPLYTFGKIAYREEATEKNIKVKEEGVVAKQGEIIVQVSQAYYGLILANQGKDAVKEAKSYLSDTKERINRLMAVQLAQRQGNRQIPPGRL